MLWLSSNGMRNGVSVKPGLGFTRVKGRTMKLFDAQATFIATVIERTYALSGKELVAQ